MSNEQYDGSGFIGSYHFIDNLDVVYAAAAGTAPGGSMTARKIKVVSADNDPDDVAENQEGTGGASRAWMGGAKMSSSLFVYLAGREMFWLLILHGYLIVFKFHWIFCRLPFRNIFTGKSTLEEKENQEW